MNYEEVVLASLKATSKLDIFFMNVENVSLLMLHSSKLGNSKNA